jgi:hypothetical protein
MRVVTVTLESVSPYSQSRFYKPECSTLEQQKETKDATEARTWRERCHTTAEGHLFMPPMAFKNCLSEAARFLSVQIPGKGKATYTKHFEAGVLVMEGIVLPETKDTVKGEWLHVPSDGRRGGGKRVEKCFPVVHAWKGDVTFHILDETISREVFEQHIREAGNFIGVGRFRPRNNGFYGRFKVVKVVWG